MMKLMLSAQYVSKTTVTLTVLTEGLIWPDTSSIDRDGASVRPPDLPPKSGAREGQAAAPKVSMEMMSVIVAMTNVVKNESIFFSTVEKRKGVIGI